MLKLTMMCSEVKGKGITYPLMEVALMTTIFAMNSLVINFAHLACVQSWVLDGVNFSLSEGQLIPLESCHITNSRGKSTQHNEQ